MDESATDAVVTPRQPVRWRDVALGAGVTLVGLAVLLALLVWSLPTAGDGGSPATVPAGVPPEPSPPSLEPGQTWFADLDLETALVATGDGPLHDVAAEGSDVLVDGDGVRAGWLEVDATLPFATAAEQIGDGVTLSDAGGNQVRVTRETRVAGREVTISGTGSVRVEDGRLVVTPRQVDLGPGWLSSAVSGAVEDLVTVRHTVKGLPEGTRLRHISVQEKGFAVHLSGRDVRLAG